MKPYDVVLGDVDALFSGVIYDIAEYVNGFDETVSDYDTRVDIVAERIMDICKNVENDLIRTVSDGNEVPQNDSLKDGANERWFTSYIRSHAEDIVRQFQIDLDRYADDLIRARADTTFEDPELFLDEDDKGDEEGEGDEPETDMEELGLEIGDEGFDI